MKIPFTQYLLPNGRRQEIEIEVDETVGLVAAKLIARGHRFDAEVLTTSEVSLTCELVDPEDEDEPVVAHEIVANGPGVLAAVTRLVFTAESRYPGDLEDSE